MVFPPFLVGVLHLTTASKKTFSLEAAIRKAIIVSMFSKASEMRLQQGIC